MLFVIEGLDGAGKSTQVHKLKDYLESLDTPLEYIHFPRYDAPVYGGLIGRFLKGDFGSIDKVHPQLVALLFAEDRHAAGNDMKAQLAEGGNVLLDRYVYSNIAYQCAKLESAEEAEDLRKWIIDTEFGNFGLPRPDLNIFLDVPLAFVEKMLAKNRKGDDRSYLQGSQDIHEASIAFQARVREMYLTQCKYDPCFIRIDCSDDHGEMRPAEEIFTMIKAEVDKKYRTGLK